MRRIFSTLVRLVHLAGVLAAASLDGGWENFRWGRRRTRRQRAEWFQRWSLRVLRVLRVSVERQGWVPQAGILASNHLSYLDILVLGSGQPTVFVSKHEVRDWPLVGMLTRMAGTLYIRRDQRSDVARLGGELFSVIGEGLAVGLFPEGTSTDGHRVLPFHSSLFAPAAEQHWPVVPVWIGYSVEEGSVEDEVCYWRDMTFLPHLVRLLGKRPIVATVRHGDPLQRGLGRKDLARVARRRVIELGREAGRRFEEPAISEREFAETEARVARG